VDTSSARVASRLEIDDVLHRYCIAIDTRDFVALAAAFTTDAEFILPGQPAVVGNLAIAESVRRSTEPRSWQQHFLTVCQVSFKADDRVETLSYLMSHKTFIDEPDRVSHLCGRYVDELRLIEGKWLIASKRLYVGWVEDRRYPQDPAVSTDRYRSGATAPATNG
jgi:3-phenylpropionate/cinnamic acid dioxygenase small subunit